MAPHTQIKRLNLDGSKRMERPEPETARTPEDLAEKRRRACNNPTPQRVLALPPGKSGRNNHSSPGDPDKQRIETPSKGTRHVGRVGGPPHRKVQPAVKPSSADS